MERLKAIAQKGVKTEEEIEKDLRYILRQKLLNHPIILIKESEYYFDLIALLKKIRCLEEGFLGYELTEEGERVAKRGWVIYNIRKEKILKGLKIVGICATIATAIFGMISTLR